jgi:hypothetical protein
MYAEYNVPLEAGCSLVAPFTQKEHKKEKEKRKRKQERFQDRNGGGVVDGACKNVSGDE